MGDSHWPLPLGRSRTVTMATVHFDVGQTCKFSSFVGLPWKPPGMHRGDELALADADLGAVSGRHPDDGADAVVVDEEGEQHAEGLPVLAQAP